MAASNAEVGESMDDFMFLFSIAGPVHMIMAYTCMNCGGSVMARVEIIDKARQAHRNYHNGQMPVWKKQP